MGDIHVEVKFVLGFISMPLILIARSGIACVGWETQIN